MRHADDYLFDALLAAALKEVHEWVENERPGNCTIVHREKADEVFSICVELAEDE